MPTLPTYTAQIGNAPASGGRRAGAEDFGVDMGNAGASLQQLAKGLQDRTEEDEARKALVASSEIRAKYGEELNKAALSGAPLEPLKEKMHADLAKVSETFQTRRGADAIALYTANSDISFDQKANEIHVTRAAAEAKTQGASFIRSESLLVQQDPSRLARGEENVTAFMATYAGRVPPHILAKMTEEYKQDLNVAAALSVARTQPEAALERLKAGEWDLSVPQRDQLRGVAEQEIRGKRAEEDYQRGLKKQAEVEANEVSYDKHLKSIMGGKASRREILDDPKLKASTREHLLETMEQRAKALTSGDRKSDPMVVRDLWLRINAPDGAPNKIYTAEDIRTNVAAGRVNLNDANMLTNMVANQKDENGRNIGQRLGTLTATVGRALSQDPKFTAQPALVAEIQMDYQSRVFDRANKLREAKQDPSGIFDPTSKDYVGSREFIQQSIDQVQEKQRAGMPQPTKVNSQAEYDALPDGAPYVDSTGRAGTKRGGKKATSDSGASDFDRWMAATGGALKPGQNQQQAVAEWKARK